MSVYRNKQAGYVENFMDFCIKRKRYEIIQQMWL
jgi:hypothetical protein